MTDLLGLPTFVSPEAIRVVVESPKGSAIKLKYDPDHQLMTLSRPLTVGLTYPFDWGLVPSTRGPDGDPIDEFATVAFEGRELKLLGWGGPEDAMTLVRASQTHAGMRTSRS